MELIVIENLIKNLELEIKCENDMEDQNRSKLKNEIKNLSQSIKENKKDYYKIEIIEDGLIMHEFNLFWNHRIITGDFRRWRKKCTEAIWKMKF